ncbi:hypothetical protein A2U01_0054990, partial [Trifolium medium]|nr:hypothetical protein [Trifolium medium]
SSSSFVLLPMSFSLQICLFFSRPSYCHWRKKILQRVAKAMNIDGCDEGGVVVVIGEVSSCNKIRKNKKEKL